MSKKSVFKQVNIPGGSIDTHDFPVIPSGGKWIIETFGAIDINNGDNCSSAYLLRFGTQVIKPISLTGNTIELTTRFEIVGNGTDYLNVIMQNNSTATKKLMFWIEAHSL